MSSQGAQRWLFSRDRVYALTGADLTIAPGETVGVVGESGCGKSTLAKVLVGVQRPTSGHGVVPGRGLWDDETGRRTPGGHRHGIGMIFQDPSTALNRRLTIRQIMRDPLDVHRAAPAEREDRVRELMSLVGLPRSVADACPASCPAASGNGWRSHGRWRWTPTCWWPTNRPARWTSRSGPRSSTCSST
jgi:peptide/nickel transport system ATP-binding protein